MATEDHTMIKKVSIIIPNFNGKDILGKNLPVVLKACEKFGLHQTEIIVVDDASSDESVSFVEKNFPQIKLVIHQVNQFFAATCNTGVSLAKGQIVVLLNSDVVPEVDFLPPLVNHFNNEETFSVGCREVDCRNGKEILSGKGIMMFKRGLVVHRRAPEQDAGITSWTSAGSAAYSREKWEKLGGLDTLFRPAYEEDRDLSYRASKHGWVNLYEPKSVVHHHHETTNQKVFGNRKIEIYSFKNQFLFVWKNITDSKYLLSHLVWLPYHLTLTNFRTDGRLLQGFILALKQLPEVLKSRRSVKKFFVKKDCELI